MIEAELQAIDEQISASAVKITLAMLEAGLCAFSSYDHRFDAPAEAVRRIFEAMIREEAKSMDTPTPPAELPAGEYAIVEIMGHQTVIGRITEVDRFGTKFMQIEPVYKGELLPPILQGGASIYRMTPCSPELAAARSPTEPYYLPTSVRATLPPEQLPAPV